MLVALPWILVVALLVARAALPPDSPLVRWLACAALEAKRIYIDPSVGMLRAWLREGSFGGWLVDLSGRVAQMQARLREGASMVRGAGR